MIGNKYWQLADHLVHVFEKTSTQYRSLNNQLILIHSYSFKQKRFPLKSSYFRGCPGGAVVRNPPASAGHMGSSPGPGRSHMSRSS